MHGTVKHMAEPQPGLQLQSRPKATEQSVRPPLSAFDRLKVTVVVLLIGLLMSFARVEANPVLSWGEALYRSYIADGWILVALLLEAVRQASFLIAEHSQRYHQFWKKSVFERWTKWVTKMDAWTVYRSQRASRTVGVLILLALVLGIFQNRSPLAALASAPGEVWERLPFLFQIFIYALMAILQFVAIFWFLSRGGVDTYMPNEIQTRFTDIWGQDHVIDKVKEGLVFLEQPEIVEQVGGYAPSGVLLWGPPGTGKTLIAKAVAGETGKPFISVEPSAFQAMFVGVGAMKVKALFRKMRKLSLRYGGVIVFFDEADSLGNRGQLAQGGWRADFPRGGDGHERWLSDYTRRILHEGTTLGVSGAMNPIVVAPGGGGGMGTLQALLSEMQGMEKPRGFLFRNIRKLLGMAPKQPPTYRIMYIMATNMPDALDQALLRPGRIDRIYKVGFPTKEGRKRTYEGYLTKVPHALSPEQLEKLASMSPPRTGAEIKDVVNEALIHALKRGVAKVEWNDIIHARYIRQTGLPEGFVYVDWERHAVAVHEACHAVAAVHLRPWYPIDVATIERRGDIGGFVSSVDGDEQFVKWGGDFEAEICVSLASLAGETMFFGGDNSAGVSGDLKNATTIAYQMHGVFGMRGSITSLLGRPGAAIGDLKEGVSASLDERVESTLRQLYERVGKLLVEKRHEVLAVAHALETHKTITGEDIDAILYHGKGPNVDGRIYTDEAFMRAIEEYHDAASEAQRTHDPVARALPVHSPADAVTYFASDDDTNNQSWPELWQQPKATKETNDGAGEGDRDA
jgi:ATP-dependent Zn protease